MMSQAAVSSSATAALLLPSATNLKQQAAAAAARDRRRSGFNPPPPWFGIDIGGTLVKLVYFEPNVFTPRSSDAHGDSSSLVVDADDDDNAIITDANEDEDEHITILRKYLTSTTAYGNTGRRDEHLELKNITINNVCGTLHFIRFPTLQMDNFVKMAREKQFSRYNSTVCATGGGAYMYEAEIRRELGLEFHKFDELDSVIGGIHFVELNSAHECYTYDEDPLNPAPSMRRKVLFSSIRNLYPYLVVNIGSGVSILRVGARNQYERISGTSIGGATFLGLACLLTGCQSYEEAIALAQVGNPKNVDKLVRDIYGGDYSKFHLNADLCASSFGQMIDPAKRAGASREDLARSLLDSITYNIGQIALLCARNEKVERIIFVGSFLRINEISARLLAYAMQYWSGGTTRALFMEHEGYFGAVGCLMELMKSGNSTSVTEEDGGVKVAD